jgi:hypothetical protein
MNRTILLSGCTPAEAVARLRRMLERDRDDGARQFETTHLLRGDLDVDAIDGALAVLTDEAAIDDVLAQVAALLDRDGSANS